MDGNSFHSDGMKGSCTSSEKEISLVTSFIKTYIRNKYSQSLSKRNIASTQRYKYGIIKRLFLRLHAIYPKQCLSYVKFREMYFNILVDESSKLKIVSELTLLRNAYMCRKFSENSYNYAKSIHYNNTPLSNQISMDYKSIAEDSKRTIGKNECENEVVMKLNIEDDSILIIQNNSDSESDTELNGNIKKSKCCVDNSVMDVDSTMSEASISVKSKVTTHIKQTFLNPPILPPCHCARNCYMMFTKEHRTKVYTNFWSIPSYQAQKKWMLEHISPVKSSKPHNHHYKSNTKVQYFLEDELSYPVPVCAVYFLKTLGLGKFTKQGLSGEAGTSQAIHNCHSFIRDHEDLNCSDKDSIAKPHTNFKATKRQVSKGRFSVKNLYSHFMTTYPSCPVSFNKYSILYRQTKSAEKSYDTCKNNENNFCVSSFNERIRNSIQKMEVESAEETSPKIRRSSRQTRMQGSMAEDDLLQQDCESLSFSALATTPQCKVNKSYNLYTNSLVQSKSGLASSSPTEEACRSQTIKGRNKRKSKLSSGAVLIDKSSNAQRSAKNTSNKLIPKHRDLAPLMKKHRHPILPSCNCSRRKCIEKISEERRHAIHHMFWALHSYKERKRWLMKYVEKTPSKSKLSLAPLPHKKHISKKYYFPDGFGRTVEVCRLFFIHTLGFRWDSVVDTIARAKQPVSIDRKKHFLLKKSARQLPEHIITSVKDYLESVRLSLGAHNVSVKNEITESHIDDLPGLKSKELFADYKKKHKHLKFNLGYHSFRRIFQTFVDPESIPNAELESESKTSNAGDPSSKTTADKTTENNSEIKNQFNQVIPKSDGTLKTIFKRIGNKAKKKTHKKCKASSKMDHKNSTGDIFCLKKNCDELNVSDSVADPKNAVNSRCNQDVDVILDVGSGIFKPSTSADDNLNGVVYCPDLKYKKRCSHSNRNNGEFYPVLPPCKCTKRKCSEKFSESQRLQINRSFWDLDGYNERKQWILEHIKRADIKRRKVALDSTHRKLESRWYYLPDEKGERRDVCKAFFLRTLGYKWDSVIDTIGKTTPKGEKIVAPDRRGRKPPPHKISDEALNSMTLYIESVCQTYQSLYQQKSLNQKKGNNLNPAGLIPYGLTMKQLFEDYKTKHANHKFGYESFRKVFKRVHSEVLSNLPPVPEPDEAPEPPTPVAPLTPEHDYVELSSAEDFPETQEFAAPAVSTSVPYPDVNSSQPLPPLPPTPFLHVYTNPVPEPRSCLYPYPQQPNTHLSKCVELEHDHSNITEQEMFMKYPVNIYGATPSSTIPPNNFTQVSEQVNYNINSHLEMVDLPSTTNQNQLPPYLIANHEPLRRQVYQMASQYQSILHHIAESSRFFNYGGYPATEASTPSAQVKTLSGNNQEYSRECIDTFMPVTPQNFSSTALPVQYNNLHCQEMKNYQSNSVSILNSYSNNVFHQENEHAGNFDITKDQTQNDSNMADRSNSQNQGIGKKNETPKVKKEKQARGKSARNYGDHYPLLPPCNCKKKKCTDKFSDIMRQKIHDLFWGLKNYNERKQWMLLHIKREDCKRRRVDQPESTRKSESRWYYFPDDDGNLLEVCKDFFLRTLGYKWDSVIDTIRKTTPKGDKSTQPDMRGKKTPSHKLSNEVLCSVVQYIKSMQQTAQLKSGYVQETSADSSFEKDKLDNLKSPKHSRNKRSAGNTSVPYGLTMKDLFDDYKAKHASHKIGYESFRRIFKAVSNSEKILEEKIQEGYSNDVGILSF
ncbi:uncharacterized protein LOC131955823 [Physella acuta]|uniref:uncharacterized protein LOC131955823 n=1 Tax=Physella acuta TaxID=109671 RepID=UPI0027DD5E5F|nr:uncharacterized protein LOC131955823 [Physella acuta]